MVTINRKGVILSILICALFLTSSITTYASQSVEEYFNQNQEKENQEKEKQETKTNESTEVEQAEVESPNFFISLLRLVLALGVIIALIIFISKFLKNRNKYLGKQGIIENYGGISVGANKSLQTIRIGDRYYVIGVGDNIELLLEITDEETMEQLKKNENEGNKSMDFMPWIKDKSVKQNRVESQASKEFGQLFKKELTTMKEGRKQILQKMRKIKKHHDN